MYPLRGVSVCEHALSVILVIAAVAVVGFFPSGVWLRHALPLSGLAFEHFADTRWEGPTGVT
jgi:hypothetical protein